MGYGLTAVRRFLVAFGRADIRTGFHSRRRDPAQHRQLQPPADVKELPGSNKRGVREDWQKKTVGLWDFWILVH